MNDIEIFGEHIFRVLVRVLVRVLALKKIKIFQTVQLVGI